MPESKTETPNRFWSLLGSASELGVWGALAFLIIARRNFSPPLIVGLAAALILARLALNWWHNGNLRPAGPLALLFPPVLRWPLRVWAILLAMSFYLTFQYDLAVPRLSMFVMGFVTLSSLYNLAQVSRRGVAWLWIIALGWLLLATAIASGGALTASWVFLKVSLLQRLYPGYEVQVVQLANDQTTNVNILAGVVSPIIMPPIGMVLGLLLASDTAVIGKGLRRGLIAVYVVLALFLTGLILLTQSFGGYGALAAGVAVFAALRYRKIGWLLAAAVALGVVGALLYLPTLMALSPAELDVLLRKRYFIWLRAATMIADMPFSGIGLGMFPYASRLMFANMISSITDQPPHAHNLLLELGLDFGIVGMACFVALQALLWRIGLRAIKAAPASAYAWGLRGLLAGQAMWLVFNLTDLAYPGTRASFIYWGAWALILAFAQAQNRKAAAAALAPH